MSWLFSSEANKEQQSGERQHNTRSNPLPLHPPLGTERPASPLLPPRAVGVGRARSPRPPSTPQVVGQQFFFPPTNIESIVTAESTVSKVEGSQFPVATESDFEDFEEDTMAMSPDAQAVLAAAQALTAALPSLVSKKKPDLPAFDKRNVEIWIKRVESAFTRAGVVSAKDKFAFLEAKFPVDYNSKINEFLYGEETDEKWNEFLAYLKKEYGQTKRQQAATILSPFPRNGVRPSQQLASLIEKANLLTLDDIYKEIIFKGLPADVRHSVVDKLDSLTAAETAELADKYFDREGKPLSSASASVNAVEEQKHQQPEHSQYTRAFVDSDEDEADVNAVGKYKGVGRRFGDSSNSGQKPRAAGNSNSNSSNNSKRSNFSSNSNNTNRTPRLCFAHDKFGDNAWRCKTTCPRYAEFCAKKSSGSNNNNKAGNATASKRT